MFIIKRNPGTSAPPWKGGIPLPVSWVQIPPPPPVRKSGVKHTTLTKIESNVVIKPSVQTVAKIAKALDVLMEDLL
ncbi:MAG: helix-turn-helix transcriptional regulator [bacterium]|nr:helix-turn-helix transcriptional regulator [bacterium]